MEILKGFGLRDQCTYFVGSDLKTLLEEFTEAKRGFVVSEQTVASLYGHHLIQLNSKGSIILPARGEALKTRQWLARLHKCFFEAGLTRSDWVWIVGGGTLSDLAGFASAQYGRGLNVVYIPTTLLAQVDAAIGGKCGINYQGVKNLLGAIWFPRAVIVATDVLSTLSQRQLIAGQGEILKYRLLWGAPLAGDESMPDLVSRCIAYKDRIVAQDPYDTGLRIQLNLGHTLAHALEASHANILHGEAVMWGLEFALRAACSLNLYPPGMAARVIRRLRSYPRPTLNGLDFDRVYGFMCRDKKNVTSSQISMVLPQSRGGVKVVHVSRKELERCWAQMRANSLL